MVRKLLLNCSRIKRKIGVLYNFNFFIGNRKGGIEISPVD